jgi:Arc/MetJ family transcription regulator
MARTVTIPDQLLKRAMKLSGARTPSAAVRWAFKEALRSKYIKELASRRMRIDFELTGDDMERREINARCRKRAH